VFRYGNSGEKDQALQRYLATEGAVLIAPSMDRGVDLPGDACRVQVVAKVPFPNLGDKQVNKRLYTRGGQEWYAVQAVRSLVQMTGRGVRSPEDHAMCLNPEARILTKDLRWVQAGDLEIGDRIIGFDERQGTRQEPRRWRDAEVVATGIRTLDRILIHLADGRTLIATSNHRWIVKDGQSRTHSWVRTDQLRVGYKLNHFAPVWERDDTWEAGWLAGLYDGEGHLAIGVGARNRTILKVVAAQKPGPVMDRTMTFMKDKGFAVHLADHQAVHHLHLNGGFAEHLRFLGQIRPVRLLSKFEQAPLISAFQAKGYITIIGIEPAPPGPMVTLQSSTETYIAEGFGSHNTYIFDHSFTSNIWRKSRMLLPKWWVEAIDWRTDPRKFIGP